MRRADDRRAGDQSEDERASACGNGTGGLGASKGQGRAVVAQLIALRNIQAGEEATLSWIDQCVLPTHPPPSALCPFALESRCKE